MQRNMYQRRNQRLERSFQFTGLDLTEFRTLFSLVVGLDISIRPPFQSILFSHPSYFPLHPFFYPFLSIPTSQPFLSILTLYSFQSILYSYNFFSNPSSLHIRFPIHPYFTSFLVRPHFSFILLSFISSIPVHSPILSSSSSYFLFIRHLHFTNSPSIHPFHFLKEHLKSETSEV